MPTGSPYDAEAAVERLLTRLRAQSGATRVSVWVHDASTRMVVPFGSADVDTAGTPGPPQGTAVTLSSSPFMSAIIRSRQSLVARADGRRASDRELAERGIRSAHGEPLHLDGELVGVLTVEPAAAAATHLLRQVSVTLAAALAEASTRRGEKLRAARSEVLLRLIESAGTAPSTDHLLGDACRTLTGLAEVEQAGILLLENGRLVPRMAVSANGRGGPGTRDRLGTIPLGLQLADRVLRTGRPVGADGTSGLLAGWRVDDVPVASGLAVPLGRAPYVTGVLTLASSHAHAFPEEVRRLAAAAGAHLGGVLEQVRTGHDRAALPPTARGTAASAAL